MLEGTDILWLRPSKDDHVSVGRQRVADRLEARGATVNLRGVTGATARQALREAGAYDAIIGTTRSGALVGMLANLRHGTPLIVDHIDPIRQFYETAPRWLAAPVHVGESLSFALADHVCRVSEDDAERVGRWARSVTPTTLGVPYEAFANPDPDVVAAADARLQRADLRPHVAIYIGSLEPLYHIEALLGAVARAEDWSLVVLGDGSLSATVAEAAARHEQIHYPGAVPHRDIPGWLACADVGVCLADEPDTVKVLEYGAAGLPVVQLDGRARERYRDLLCYVDGSVGSICEGFRRAATWPQHKLDRLQSLAQHFDWNAVADEYASAVKAVVDGSATGGVPEPEPRDWVEIATAREGMPAVADGNASEVPVE